MDATDCKPQCSNNHVRDCTCALVECHDRDVPQAAVSASRNRDRDSETRTLAITGDRDSVVPIASVGVGMKRKRVISGTEAMDRPARGSDTTAGTGGIVLAPNQKRQCLDRDSDVNVCDSDSENPDRDRTSSGGSGSLVSRSALVPVGTGTGTASPDLIGVDAKMDQRVSGDVTVHIECGGVGVSGQAGNAADQGSGGCDGDGGNGAVSDLRAHCGATGAELAVTAREAVAGGDREVKCDRNADSDSVDRDRDHKGAITITTSTKSDPDSDSISSSDSDSKVQLMSDFDLDHLELMDPDNPYTDVRRDMIINKYRGMRSALLQLAHEIQHHYASCISNRRKEREAAMVMRWVKEQVDINAAAADADAIKYKEKVKELRSVCPGTVVVPDSPIAAERHFIKGTAWIVLEKDLKRSSC